MKYYAVKVGRNPGVYTTWPECQDQVSGFSGAVFKSFTNEAEAKAFVNGQSSNTAASTIKEDSDRIIAYVDGSYNNETDYCGYGVYIKDDKEYVFYNHFKQESGGRNVEGEVTASLVALKYAVEHKRPITIYYDYEGIEKWANGSWKRNKSYTINYHNIVQNMINNGLNVKFVHTKGHTGIKGNEYVDRLAKYACNIFLEDKDIKILLELSDAVGFPIELDF